MATTRKRTSGFSPQDDETVGIEETLEDLSQEMFETISRTEEEAEAKPEPVAPKPFIPAEIIPTEDVGPRFVEPVTPPPVEAPAPVQQLKPPPKRHPRNIPKFSRYN